MKVLLVNGSPHKNGCTYTALSQAAKELKHEGIDTEIYWIGIKGIGGCMSCHYCVKNGKCAIDDCVNEFVEKAKQADGFIFGSPVHYAAMTGNMTSFMDRVFYSAFSSGNAKSFRYKPAAGVLSARRAGTTAAFDQINKYFTISEMPIVSSRYWNMVHGYTPQDVMMDEEGVQCMRILGRNMAYMLKCIDAGRKAEIELPVREKTIMTDFIK